MYSAIYTTPRRGNMTKNEPGGSNPAKKQKRERFVRIAEKRVNKILADLENLGKCSNRHNYAYTDTDVRKIFGEIDKKIKEIKSMFQGTSKEKGRFKLEL
jgi:hypothetical protein